MIRRRPRGSREFLLRLLRLAEVVYSHTAFASPDDRAETERWVREIKSELSELSA